jgi:hypothetical protein
MTFTPTPPTEAGFYAFKQREDLESYDPGCAYEDYTGKLWFSSRQHQGYCDSLGGFWCQLTCKASAQQRLATELRKAYDEGVDDAPRYWLGDTWSASRAARVAKGEE